MTGAGTALVLAFVSAVQAVLAAVAGTWFDGIWSKHLMIEIRGERRPDPDRESGDALGMRGFFEAPGNLGKTRVDVVTRSMRTVGNVVASLSALLSLILTGALTALVAGDTAITWIAAVIGLLALVMFGLLLVLAVQGRVTAYREGSPRGAGRWRRFLDDRHFTVMYFYRDTMLTFNVILIGLSAWLTL
ncbi:hypothetical protein ACFY36_05840 [Actinoplanes sp. NPDC000266]